MNYKTFRNYMNLCEYYGWVPSWEGLKKYAEISDWREQYIGGGKNDEI